MSSSVTRILELLGDDLSYIHYEELVELEHKLERLRNKVQARKEALMEMENQEETHMEGGLRFTLLQYTIDHTMHYYSFDELGLKQFTTQDLVISGFKRNPNEDIPISTGFFRVGDTLFMVGGLLEERLEPTNCLRSALTPPAGSFSEPWTLCPATMKLKRSHPVLVPLHDGRIFICGGTGEQQDWAEFYDPEKGEFDGKDLPVGMGCPYPTSCFQYTDQLVMVYYHDWVCDTKEYNDPSLPPLTGEDNKSHHKPSLLSYNIANDTWDIFAENLPERVNAHGPRNLVYVGGDILFIIDSACHWFVYDMSSKKEVGEVAVKAKPRGQRAPVMGAFYSGNKDIKSTSWVFYVFMPSTDYGRLEYAKVEVVQGKGGDYIATVQRKGDLRGSDFAYVDIIAEEDGKEKEKIDDRQVNESL